MPSTETTLSNLRNRFSSLVDAHDELDSIAQQHAKNCFNEALADVLLAGESAVEPPAPQVIELTRGQKAARTRARNAKANRSKPSGESSEGESNDGGTS